MVNFGEIQSPYHHVGTPWIFSDLFKAYSDAKERVGCEKQREATESNQSVVKLQPWFLILQWKTCLRQNCSQGSCSCSERPALVQNTLMMMMMISVMLNKVL